MHMVNSNQEVKPDSLWRALDFSSIFLKRMSWGAQLPSWFREWKSTSRNDATNEYQVKMNVKHKCKQYQVE